MLFKQSTVGNWPVLLIDSSDHVTGKTGLTLTIKASKDGAAFATITPTVTELESGWYNLALTTAHTNTLGAIALQVSSTGADPTGERGQVVADLPGATVASVSGAVGSVTGAVGSVTGAVGSVTGAVGSVTGAVGSVTGNVGGNVTGSVGSVASYGTLVADVVTAVWAAGTRSLTTFGTLVADAAAAVWASVARTLTAGDNIVLAKGTGITGLNDIAAVEIVSNGAITTSAGKVSGVTLVDTISEYTGNTLQTADVGARIPANIAMTGNKVWALDASGNPIAPASGVNVTQIGGYDQSSFVDVPAVLAELTNTKVGTGVNYGSGYTLFNNIYDLMVQLLAVKTQTDLLPASPAATGDIPSAATIADTVRDVDNSAPAAGSLGEAVRGADAKAAEIKDLIGTPDVTVSDDIAAVMARLGAPAGASISADVAALLAAIDALPDPDFDAAADALLDRADAVEVGLTPRQYMRLTAAVLGGKLSGANTATNVFRNAVADDKDRVTATADSHGNRSAIVTDLA